MDWVPEDEISNEVERSRNEPFGCRVLAVFPPTTDSIIFSLDCFEQFGNILGIVLQIAIHTDDIVACGVGEAGRKSRCLTKVFSQPIIVKLRTFV